MKKNIEKVCGFRKMCYLCNRNRERCFLEIRNLAEIAQLVEHNLAKVGVAGPSPVFRSKSAIRLLFYRLEPKWRNW